jgi:hypothetical protein
MAPLISFPALISAPRCTDFCPSFRIAGQWEIKLSPIASLYHRIHRFTGSRMFLKHAGEIQFSGGNNTYTPPCVILADEPCAGHRAPCGLYVDQMVSHQDNS